MLAVVPDTNVLFGAMTGGAPRPAWRRLLALSAAAEIDVVLPEIVQWELANQLRESIEQTLDGYSTSRRRLERAGLTPPQFPEADGQAAEIVVRETDRVRQVVLWHDGQVAPVPNVLAAELAQRSLERRPPFDERDRGMRDTLLWLTVLDLVRTGATVILVSNDKGFGCDRLLPELETEAGPGAVVLARDLDQALTEVLGRSRAARDAAWEALEDDGRTDDIMMSVACRAIGTVLDGPELARQGWPRELRSVELMRPYTFGGLDIVHAERTTEGLLRLTARAEVDFEIEVHHDGTIAYEDFQALTDGAVIYQRWPTAIGPGEVVEMLRSVDLVVELVLTTDGSEPGVDITPPMAQMWRRTIPAGQMRLEMAA